MVAMQRALGSVFGKVGGDVKGDVISREKQHQYTSADTMNRWGKSAKSERHKGWKMVQLGHAAHTHSVRPLANKSRLRYGSWYR